MFVGHGLLAFALAAGLAHARGVARERALTLGLLAGAFGLAPDVDVAYALVGLVGSDSLLEAAGGFWAASARVHRVVTHSFVVGSVAALAAGGLAAAERRAQLAGGLLLCGLAIVAAVVSGALGGAVTALFVLTVAALATVGRLVGIGPAGVATTAALGLLSHPPGDLLTGEPPAFLYPFDITLVAARPTVSVDPTLNLLAPLFLELSTFWIALIIYLWATGAFARSGWATAVGRRLQLRAALGIGFAGFAAVAPAPTLDVSYHFVFPLLGIGFAAAAPVPAVEASSLVDLRRQATTLAVTGLTAVTLAAVAYTAAYLVAG
ncbi:metal-dependent hydrolase [Halosegnis sp.]|uniref:metal-dependent hydrolase n=1 Tax=Halosegnis sp. TaxID=2864959 RepID=UPI0035D43CA4